MNNKIYNLINNNGETIIVYANSPEYALIKAQRLGDLGWSIDCELSDTEYCYNILKTELSKCYDELTDDLCRYFKAIIKDCRFDAYIYADCIENVLCIRNHKDIVNYVLENY